MHNLYPVVQTETLSKYENIRYEENSIYPFAQLNESTYIESVLHHLSTLLGEAFQDFIFFIYSQHGPGNLPPKSAEYPSDKKKVLLYFSDEHGEDPIAYSSNYYAVFKAYVGLAREASRIFPLPIGLVKDVPAFPVVPIHERKINVFFSGNLNSNRLGFYKSLAGLSRTFPLELLNSNKRRTLLLHIKRDFSRKFPDSTIKFNNGFKSGLSPYDYGYTLAQSKIVLCPKGFLSPECFRHYEAIRTGCIVISEKLPDNHLYKNSPIIQVDNWEEGLGMVEQLLRDPHRMQQLHLEALDWWDQVFSEKAAAHYIASHLL